jgi:hypothetical protein
MWRKIEIQKELAVIKFQYTRVVLVDLHIVLFMYIYIYIT